MLSISAHLHLYIISWEDLEDSALARLASLPAGRRGPHAMRDGGILLLPHAGSARSREAIPQRRNLSRAGGAAVEHDGGVRRCWAHSQASSTSIWSLQVNGGRKPC